MNFVTGLGEACTTPVPETTVELVQSVGVRIVAVSVKSTVPVTDSMLSDVAYVLQRTSQLLTPVLEPF